MKKFLFLFIYVMAVLFTCCDSNAPAPLKAFSIAEGNQVVFSRGNLQYTQSTNIWSFAENQWDYIGTDNVIGGNASSDSKFGDTKDGNALADKVDLFGWSSNSTYFGVNTSTDKENDYLGIFVDWGVNKIGDDAPNIWRTLTNEEWEYLLNTRPNASSLKGIASVNGVNGLILLPDNWRCPSGVTFNSGFHSSDSVWAYSQYQSFTLNTWSRLESAGAVFLPAAGVRVGSGVGYVQTIGYYRSSTETDSIHAYYLFFCSDESCMINANRILGQSVRLVKDL